MAASLPILHAHVRADSPADGSLHGKIGQQDRRHLQGGSNGSRSKSWLAKVGLLAVAAVVLLLLVSHKVAGPCSATASFTRLNQHSKTSTPAAAAAAGAAAAGAAAAGLGPTTDVPMMVLPPFAPTCKVKILGKDTGKFGCPILSCRMDANCTINEPSCCAYLHYEMLSFFNQFVASKCLQHEYVLAHGTALGAVRDSTIIAHTQDLDLAVTPYLIQFLELNSTREELWRHGYAVFMGEDVFWKFHPHIHHPKPEFRAAFKTMGEEWGTWQNRTNGTMAVYMDLWPMWPVPANLTDCGNETHTDHYEQIAVPWDNTDLWDGARLDTCSPKYAPASQSTGVVSTGDRVCSVAVNLPWNLTGGGATARIGNESFPVPANYDEVFQTTYGGNWRIPNTTNRGTWPTTQQGWELVWTLEAKLSITAWGDMDLQKREWQCAKYWTP